MEKLRVGLIGVGNICTSYHIPILLKSPNVEIVAICDINPDKIEAAKKTLNDVKSYASYIDMINDIELDLIHICTPNYLHSEISVACLNKDINVFCEKPDAVSVEEVLKMSEAAKKSKGKLMVMRNNRHVKVSKQLKERIDNGEFGELYTGRCGWIRKRGIPGRGGWFTTKSMSGGGPLIDLGVHMIDLAIYLMGNPKPISVTGSIYQKFSDNKDESDSKHSTFGQVDENGINDVEDLAIGFIKFDNGASLQIEFSWASNIEKETNFVELRGEKKGFLWEDRTYKTFDANKKSIFQLLKEKLPKLNKEDRGHKGNILHFIDVLVNDVEPDFNIEQGINMIKILESIYESAKTGKEVLL